MDIIFSFCHGTKNNVKPFLFQSLDDLWCISYCKTEMNFQFLMCSQKITHKLWNESTPKGINVRQLNHTPSVWPVIVLTFFTPVSREYRALSTYSSNNFPYFVRTTPRPCFLKSLVLSYFSRLPIAWLKLGWRFLILLLLLYNALLPPILKIMQLV